MDNNKVTIKLIIKCIKSNKLSVLFFLICLTMLTLMLTGVRSFNFIIGVLYAISTYFNFMNLIDWLEYELVRQHLARKVEEEQ